MLNLLFIIYCFRAIDMRNACAIFDLGILLRNGNSCLIVPKWKLYFSNLTPANLSVLGTRCVLLECNARKENKKNVRWNNKFYFIFSCKKSEKKNKFKGGNAMFTTIKFFNELSK